MPLPITSGGADSLATHWSFATEFVVEGSLIVSTLIVALIPEPLEVVAYVLPAVYPPPALMSSIAVISPAPAEGEAELERDDDTEVEIEDDGEVETEVEADEDGEVELLALWIDRSVNCSGDVG